MVQRTILNMHSWVIDSDFESKLFSIKTTKGHSSGEVWAVLKYQSISISTDINYFLGEVVFFSEFDTFSELIISRRRRTRTVKVRTALSRPCPAGQTDNGQLFPKIWKNPDVCVWLYFKLWNHCVYNHSFFRTLKWNRCKLTLWIYNPMERRSRSEYLESRWHSEDLENSGFKRLKKSGFEST